MAAGGPTFGVEVVVVQEGRVLLIQRRDFRVWALPGGGVDPGESAAGAAVRETREESGLEVALTGLVGVYSRPGWMLGDHDLLFAARPLGGALKRRGEEVVDAAFFAPGAWPEPLVYWHRQRLADALEGRRGIARTQHTPWPFDPGTTLQDLRRCLAAGELSLRDLHAFFAGEEGAEGALETEA